MNNIDDFFPMLHFLQNSEHIKNISIILVFITSVYVIVYEQKKNLKNYSDCIHNDKDVKSDFND